MMRTQAQILLALLAGCTSSGSDRHATGDLAPKTLFDRPVTDVALGREQLSSPASPRDSVGFPEASFRAKSSDVMVIVPAGQPGTYEVPVDSTDRAILHLAIRGQASDEDIAAALRAVVVSDPTGRPINVRPQVPGVEKEDLVPLSSIELGGLPVGDYQVTVGAEAAALGLAIEVQQPQSTVALTVGASTSEVLLGNRELLSVDLEGDPTITHVSAQTLMPSGARQPLALLPIASGHFVASLGQDPTTADHQVGMYTVEVAVEGTTRGGVAFHRFASTSYHFGVPTARMNAVNLRTVEDASGVITGFDVDVRIDAASRDRYQISATLAGIGADGTERPLATAETADVVDAGGGVVTLHFDAGLIELTGLEGSFMVRNLQLYSQGTDSLYHRDGYGMNAAFPSVRHAQLAKLQTLSPAVKTLIEEGAYR